MAVHESQISSFLQSVGLQAQSHPNGLVVHVTLPEEGATPFLLVFRAASEGQIFELTCAQILPIELIQQSPHKTLFMLYLLNAAWTGSFGTPEMDSTDGEVRVLTEVPLADAVMTENQFRLILDGTLRLANRIRHEGLKVLQTGQFPEPPQTPAPQPTQSAGLDPQTAAKLAIMDAIQTPEGRQMVRQLITSPQVSAVVRQVAISMLPVIDALDRAGS